MSEIPEWEPTRNFAQIIIAKRKIDIRCGKSRKITESFTTGNRGRYNKLLKVRLLRKIMRLFLQTLCLLRKVSWKMWPEIPKNYWLFREVTEVTERYWQMLGAWKLPVIYMSISNLHRNLPTGFEIVSASYRYKALDQSKRKRLQNYKSLVQ